MLGLMLLGGCDRSDNQTAAGQLEVPGQSLPQPEPPQRLIDQHKVVELAQSHTRDAVKLARQLKLDVAAFLDAPSADTLTAVQISWQRAYLGFLSGRVLGYLPITEPVEWRRNRRDGRRTFNDLDGWPVTGGYIDHVPGYPVSGIINDLTLQITTETLLEQQGFSSEYDISVGFHALGFLLFGEDQPRDWNDFVIPETGTANLATDAGGTSGDNMAVTASESVSSQETSEQTDAPSADTETDAAPAVLHHQRRREYLGIVTRLLLAHLERLQRRWSDGGHYASVLINSDGARLVSAVRMALTDLIQQEMLARRIDSSEWRLIRGRQAQAELETLNASTVALLTLLLEHQTDAELQQWLQQVEADTLNSADKTDESRKPQLVKARVMQLLPLLQ